MSDLVLAAIISGGITAGGAALHYLLSSAREQGRADAYEVQSRATIEAKNAELETVKGQCQGQLAEKDKTIAYLRSLLATREEAEG